jgi:predicted DCC family thiol-disulfide oxidoreductase YuxK
MNKIDKTKAVILFDGVCNLCNQVVNFVLRWDRKRIFLFAPLQSTTAKSLVEECSVNGTDSVIVLWDGMCYVRSEAMLVIAHLIGFPWSLAYVFVILPTRWRNQVYEWVAKNRYRWFGQRTVCRIPTPEERARFLE